MSKRVVSRPDTSRPVDPQDRQVAIMRCKHDAFVAAQAKRLGVEPRAIIAAVRDFGHTAEDIVEAKDAAALTRYPAGDGESIAFTVVGYVPIR